MSLIHWWPLNGDTRDKITNNILTNTSAVLAPSKIGQGYYFDGSTNCHLYAPYDKPQSAEEISFAFWIKLDSSWSNWGKIFVIGPSGSSIWPNVSIGVCGRNDGNVYFSVSNGSSYTGVNGPYHHLDLETWYHITCIYNRGNLTMYVNGIPAAGRATISTSIVPNFTQENIISLGGEESYSGECTICDVRIYDHALSAFEVKEIAKALIMHYNFNDVYAEPTTNLLPASLQNKYVENVADAASYTITSGLTASAYTLSANIKRHIGDQSPSPYVSLNVTYSDGTSKNITTTTAVDGYNIRGTADGQFHYYKLTILNPEKKAVTQVNGWILDRGTYTSGTPRYMTVKNAQLEAKDHPTPYTESSRTAKTYNETALVQPTVLQNINYSSDSANGGYSLLCNNTHLKTLSSTYDQEELTLAAWVKPFSEGSGAIILGGAYLVMSGKKISVYCYDKNPAGYHTSSKEMTLNEWHHIAVVWDKEYCRGYIDGELVIEKACISNEQPDASRKHLHDKKDIGSENGTSRIFDGLIDDARVYNTALSQDDIVDLYKTKAYIIENGDIACGEFTEGCIDALITEKAIFETNEIYENALPDGYEQLESISFDYVANRSEPYINTGYNTTDIYQIDCDIEVAAAASNYQFGQQQKGGWMYNGFYSTGSLEFNWAALTPRPAAQARHTMTQTLSEDGSALTIVIDGVTWTTTPGTNGQGGDFYIFACRNGSNAFRHYGASMTLYSFRIHEGYRTVRDFVPARRRSDGVIGLYDKATQMLYTNAGTGEFKAGPVVTNNEAMIYENGNIYGKEIIEI